ncbi:TetR/AcrR family transcriptional regulator [Polymorphobacter sp.]|uniref:TetR/AcrR family transcriptional regulator n=1 Tax=Polymorphobacter sp. TaxID=1909290 RepID=UPI003F701888
MSLTEQRSHETRQRLIDAARAGFMAQGYDATGTANILRAAGVQRGTLYHHFADKAALLEAVCRQLAGEALLAVTNACCDQPETGWLLAGSLAWLDHLDIPGHRRVWLRDAPAALPDALHEELAMAGIRGWLQDRLVADSEAGRLDLAGRADISARMIEGALAGLAGTERKGRERLVRDLLGRFSQTPGNNYLKLLARGRAG